MSTPTEKLDQDYNEKRAKLVGPTCAACGTPIPKSDPALAQKSESQPLATASKKPTL